MDPIQSPLQDQQSNKDFSKEDIVDLLHEEDDSVDKNLDKSEKEDKDKEDKREAKEEKEDEEIKLAESEEEIEPEVELQLPVRRQEILKKYPTIFKEFPALERAYYTSQEFIELLGSPDDAKEVLQKAQEFEKYQEEITTGNLQGVIKNLQENNPKAYEKLVDNYLPSLAKTDPNAYYAVMGNVMRHTVINMAREAKRIDNEKLEEAALILNQFIFGNSDIQNPVPFAKGDDKVSEAELQLQQREQQFVRQQFERAHEDLAGRVDNILRETVSRHIDPKGTMGDYVKKNAIKDAVEAVQETIGQDMTFRRYLDGLWKTAFKNSFDKKSVDTIRSAYLSKAKTLLPETIKKIRNEALKGVSSSRRESNEDRSEQRPPISRGRASSAAPDGKGGKEFTRGMKTLDYLMQDD
jgi:hypothetical protein